MFYCIVFYSGSFLRNIIYFFDWDIFCFFLRNIFNCRSFFSFNKILYKKKVRYVFNIWISICRHWLVLKTWLNRLKTLLWANKRIIIWNYKWLWIWSKLSIWRNWRFMLILWPIHIFCSVDKALCFVFGLLQLGSKFLEIVSEFTCCFIHFKNKIIFLFY